MDYIAQPKDYWIALNAINITLNALGDPNRTQGSVASGAAILCYIEGIDGLGYDNGHRFRTWPLTISPTYFNSNTAKYVYVAIPRTSSVGTQAVVVFPSEKLDIYGVNESDAQVGSTDYYYIWLQGIITATDGTSIREWAPRMNFGQKGTDEDLYDDTSSEWYQYSKVSEVVTFLKNIAMKAGTTFQNLILGYKELTGVATSDIAYTDSDTLVATPGYVESQYLSKTHESEAQKQIGFLKGLWVGVRNLYEITANGIAKLKSVIAEDVNSQRVQTAEIKSPNYTGDGVADTGFRLTNAYNGHSKLTIDEIYVRMKAVFESLEVRERTYTGGDQIWSCAGNRIIRVDYLGNVETADHVPQMMNVHADGRPEGQGQGDVYSVPVPGDTYGYSDVKVPWLLRQMPLLARAKVFARYRKVRIIINEPSASGARRAVAESPLANIRRARCYFLAKDDDMEVHNWWRINDLARCQTMNLANTTRKTYLSGEDEKAGNIFWWRKVIGVSYEPVTLDDGKQYHYFDVAFDYEYEQTYPEVMATSVMEGSDIPAAQDSVVQFGNTIIEGRMNLMMMEVNGSDAVGYNPTTDAPCLKAYRGIYCFDLNKSWVGGNPCKMKLSPKSGYEFYGPNFKQVTEYDVVPVPVERGLWLDIVSTRDDYREHAMVRKCYYYDKVSHNGSYWLCSIVDGAHWVDSSGNYISDANYAALSDAAKALCSRKQNYTIEEPSEASPDWTMIVSKGDTGDKGDTPMQAYQWNNSPTTAPSPLPSGSTLGNWNLTAPTRPTSAGEHYLWMTETVKHTSASGAVTYDTWSAATRVSGDDGAAGEDAVSIVISPASLIVNQDLNNPSNLSNLWQTFVVKVYKGDVEQTVNGLSFISEIASTNPTTYKALFLNGGGQRSGNSNIAGNILTLKQINTYTQDGKTRYYDSMYADVTAIYNSNKTITARVRIYANLLGTWAETVEADVKHEVATGKFYFEDENGNVVAHETIGDFIKSSTENTSVLTKKVNEGKNLLTLTSGWEGFGGAAVNYDKKNFGVWDANSDLYSPFIWLAEGQSVCFSAYMSSGAAQSGNWYIGYGSTPPVHLSDLYDNASIPIALIQKPGDSITVDGTTYDRYYYVLNASSVLEDQYITFNLANIYKLFCPQLENGDAPTAFTAGSIETSSQIKQTAGNIELNIKNGLNEVGISILGDTNKVVAKAGTFEVHNSNGVKTFEIDNNGNLQGSGNAAFKGTVYADSGYFNGSLRTTFHDISNESGWVYYSSSDIIPSGMGVGWNYLVGDYDNMCMVARKETSNSLHVRLPNTPSMIGRRIIFYEMNQPPFSNGVSQFEIRQLNQAAFVGVSAGGHALIDFRAVYGVEICGGVVEFLAVPHPTDATICTWAIINIGGCIWNYE